MGSADIDSDSIKQLLQEATNGNLDVNNITSSEVLKMCYQHLLAIIQLNRGYLNIFTLMTYFNNIQGL